MIYLAFAANEIFDSLDLALLCLGILVDNLISSKIEADTEDKALKPSTNNWAKGRMM